MANQPSGGRQMCKHCQARPVYVENGRVHDFCGQRCRQAHWQQSPNPATSSPSVKAPVTPSPSATSNPPPGPPHNTASCALPGCRRPAYPGGLYCGHSHRQAAIEAGLAESCLFCLQFPKVTVNGKLSDFCSKKCSQDTFAAAPIILLLDTKQAIFDDVVKQFQHQWKHSSAVPTVINLWKIYSNRNVADQFSRYKKSVELRTKLLGGNSKRRFHGTVRTCKLGDDSQNTFCSDGNCSICRIIESSFKLTKAGQHTNFGRFGAGIYTSATSSKANDYVAENGGSPYKAMLLNDVVLGKTVKLKVSDPTLNQPPNGYNSVIGEPGGDLNYDESIVYQNDAIRPMFLIIYQG